MNLVPAASLENQPDVQCHVNYLLSYVKPGVQMQVAHDALQNRMICTLQQRIRRDEVRRSWPTYGISISWASLIGPACDSQNAQLAAPQGQLGRLNIPARPPLGPSNSTVTLAQLASGHNSARASMDPRASLDSVFSMPDEQPIRHSGDPGNGQKLGNFWPELGQGTLLPICRSFYTCVRLSKCWRSVAPPQPACCRVSATIGNLLRCMPDYIRNTQWGFDWSGALTCMLEANVHTDSPSRELARGCHAGRQHEHANEGVRASLSLSM